MYIIAPIIAWVIAGGLKFFINQLRFGNGKERIGNGGFPSNHTSIMTTTVMLIGFEEGFNHPTFSLGVAITMIIIFDATGLRRYVGRHATILNELRPKGSKLRESVGHKPVEIIGGLVVGTLLAFLLSLIF